LKSRTNRIIRENCFSLLPSPGLGTVSALEALCFELFLLMKSYLMDMQGVRNQADYTYLRKYQQKIGIPATRQSKRNDFGNRKGIGKIRINFKQEELIDELVNILIKKFPEVELIDITESPEDSESLWVNVTAPKDEDKEIELRAFASDKTTDILIDYGYHILVMPTHIRISTC
jgi:hypothetical protein